eukprot:COSAG06_NODE_25338_length_639_cov_1.229630_1_plen_87_part_00
MMVPTADKLRSNVGEECSIEIEGGGGVLGNCGTFDVDLDVIFLPDGSWYRGSNCPAGAMLTAGEIVRWQSIGATEARGGGWQICFV